jgi:hypothetical protein
MTIWTRDPLISEIKKGSGPNGLPPLHYRVLPYQKTVASSSYMAFNGLDAGSYKLYILATDDNPFDTANFGVMQSFVISR